MRNLGALVTQRIKSSLLYLFEAVLTSKLPTSKLFQYLYGVSRKLLLKLTLFAYLSRALSVLTLLISGVPQGTDGAQGKNNMKIIAIWKGDAWVLKNLLLNFEDFCRFTAPKKTLQIKHE